MHAHQFWILEKKARGDRRIYPIGIPLLLIDKSQQFFPSENDGTKDTNDYRLHQILDNERAGPKNVTYEYDFGDRWEHVITCNGREDATQQFVCLSGQGHPCAEDCGGVGAWLELLAAFDAKNPTDEQMERMQWYEECIGDEDSVGLYGNVRWKWDKDQVNEDLANIMGSPREVSTAYSL